MLNFDEKPLETFCVIRKPIVQKDDNNKDTLDVPVMNDGSDEII